MKLIIPMSGLGSRFAKAGYTDIKPLIPVLGKPIIEWVLKMFPDQDDILFICRQDHLNSTPLKSVLQKLKPHAEILGIEGHKKGPVYAVHQAAEHFSNDEPVLISYCDYYMHWNFQAFKTTMLQEKYAGAIPCYTGFHPHLLPPKNLYASCQVNEHNSLLEIREKYSFSADKTQSLHSPGVYYFQSGALVKTYFQKMIERDVQLGGEYYVSLVYNLMLEDGLDVFVPANVDHFCQFGTPEDLADFLFWMSVMKGVLS